MRPIARFVCGLLIVTLPHAALAQVITTEKDYASPQHFLIELKLGPYAPNIDDDLPAGGSAYGHIFGSGTNVMVQGELDWEIWRGFGTVALGGVFGYFGNSADAYADDGSNDGTPSSSTTRSGSETSITLLPMSLLAIYRFDWPAARFNFPVVPFVKAGVNYTIWWIDIDGGTAKYKGDDAKGGTFGWQLNAGLALLLDVLEPKSARAMDTELGINHTYLFFEFAHVGSLGSDKLNVGDTTWSGGLAFEF